jgi:hypothetical protein
MHFVDADMHWFQHDMQLFEDDAFSFEHHIHCLKTGIRYIETRRPSSAFNICLNETDMHSLGVDGHSKEKDVASLQNDMHLPQRDI